MGKVLAKIQSEKGGCMKETVWHRTTGIKARRVFSYSDDPEMKKEGTYEGWLAARKRGVGGSDISAIVGVNPFRSAIEVFLEKTGRIVTEENQKMRWGKILEDPVAREYAESEGVAVRRINAILQHPEHEFALVNLDRLIVKNGQGLDEEKPVHAHLLNRGNGSLEIKTTGWAKAWEGGEIPDFNYTQLQWQLGITGLKWGQFGVLISGQEFLKPAISEFNAKVFKNMLLIANRFWTENVLKDRAPEPDQNPRTKDAMKLLYPEVNEKTVSLSEEFNEAIVRRKALDIAIKTAKGQKAAIDASVLANLQNAKYGLTSRFKVTRVLRSAPMLQQKALKEAHPEICAKFTKSSESIYPLYKELKTK